MLGLSGADVCSTTTWPSLSRYFSSEPSAQAWTHASTMSPSHEQKCSTARFLGQAALTTGSVRDCLCLDVDNQE